MIKRNLILKTSCFLLAMLVVFLTPQILLAQGGEPAQGLLDQLLDFVKNNWIYLVGILYEVIARAFPNYESVSILRILMSIIDILIPDRKLANAKEGVHSLSVGDNRRYPTWTKWVAHTFPFFVSLIVIFFLWVSPMTWGLKVLFTFLSVFIAAAVAKAIQS